MPLKTMMHIFRWISDATNSRDRRRLEEARLRRNYQSIPLYRHSPRTWYEPTPRVTTAEDSPRIVFVSPDPDTMPDHHRHHRRRRHERVEYVTTDIPRYSSYIPSRSRTPYTYRQGYGPWYPTPQFHGNITEYPTTPSANITSAYDPNVQSAGEASYAQTEQDRDRRRTDEITRLTDDLRADDSDDARRERTRSRRRRYDRAWEGNYPGNETDRGERPHRNEQEIRHRIAELEANIRERESRRDRHRERRSRNNTEVDDLAGGIDGHNHLPVHYRRPRSFVPNEIRHDWSYPASISRDPTQSYSYTAGYLRPRVRFSPTASCYRDFTPRGGYESSGSEEIYYGGCRC